MEFTSCSAYMSWCSITRKSLFSFLEKSHDNGINQIVLQLAHKQDDCLIRMIDAEIHKRQSETNLQPNFNTSNVITSNPRTNTSTRNYFANRNADVPEPYNSTLTPSSISTQPTTATSSERSDSILHTTPSNTILNLSLIHI